MGLIKCPRCELNYMLDTDKFCSICKREVRGESEQYEMVELCSECGENPVVPGQELCSYCLKELAQRASDETNDDDETVVNDASEIGIDSVSSMDEIELDLDDELDEDAKAFFGEEDDEDEEDGDFPKGKNGGDR